VPSASERVETAFGSRCDADRPTTTAEDGRHSCARHRELPEYDDARETIRRRQERTATERR